MTSRELHRMAITERNPYTQGDHHFRPYRDDFLQLYRFIYRKSQSKSTIVPLLEKNAEQAPEDQTKIALALSAIAALGMEEMAAHDLLRLLSNDETNTAIKIMADVRAYFQGKAIQPLILLIQVSQTAVAYERFTDMVPQFVESHFLDGFEKDLNAITRSLAKDEDLCRQWLQEDVSIARAREQLTSTLDALQAAQKRLALFYRVPA